MPDALETLEDGIRAERAGALDRALDAYREAGKSGKPEIRAAALAHEADVHRTRCDWDAGLDAARNAQEIARKARLPHHLAEAIVAEANIHMSRGEFSVAIPMMEGIATSSSDARLRGIALQNVGFAQAQMGQLRAAERAFTESLGNFQKAGYVRGEAIALNNFGRLALDNNNAKQALPLLEQALDKAREVEDLDLVALAGLNLAWALCTIGQFDRAQDLAMAALGYYAGCGNTFREIECLRLIGDINEKCEDCANAMRCYDLALKLATEIGSEVEQRTMQDRLNALGQQQAESTRGRRGGKGDAQTVS